MRALNLVIGYTLKHRNNALSSSNNKGSDLKTRRRFLPCSGWLAPGQATRCKGAVAPSWNRQRRCRLDLLHGETRGDVLERHRRDQPLVERIVARDVGHDHAQHVV